jgi:hypothetical protein
MQCILYKIYFWKVFHMYYKLICILYALLCGQNFILVKSGCYTIIFTLINFKKRLCRRDTDERFHLSTAQDKVKNSTKAP